MDFAAPTGLDENEKLLPEYFRNGGYSTHMVGKWHLGFCKKAYWPRSRGFDSFFGILGGQVKYWDHVVAEEKVSDYFRNETPVFQKSYSGSDFTNEAIEIAQNSKKSGKPFFTYLAYLVPHAPLSASPYWEQEAGDRHFNTVWGNTK